MALIDVRHGIVGADTLRHGRIAPTSVPLNSYSHTVNHHTSRYNRHNRHYHEVCQHATFRGGRIVVRYLGKTTDTYYRFIVRCFLNSLCYN